MDQTVMYRALIVLRTVGALYLCVARRGGGLFSFDGCDACEIAVFVV